MQRRQPFQSQSRELQRAWSWQQRQCWRDCFDPNVSSGCSSQANEGRTSRKHRPQQTQQHSQR